MMKWFLWTSLFWALVPAWAEARNVPICVLNDSNAPVADEVINELIAYASADFVQQVGIRFIEVERHSYSLDPFADEQAQFERVRRTCRAGEAAIAFSSRPVAASQWYARAGQAGGGGERGGRLLGLGSTSGYAILTSVAYAMSSRDALGNLKIYGALRHELGHLFFDGHLEDERSFLYRHVNRYNEWTPETRAVIQRNRGIEWRLREEPAD